jgi:hypothetical protein
LEVGSGYETMFAHTRAFPIVSNGAYQDKPQMKTVRQVKFRLVRKCLSYY